MPVPPGNKAVDFETPARDPFSQRDPAGAGGEVPGTASQVPGAAGLPYGLPPQPPQPSAGATAVQPPARGVAYPPPQGFPGRPPLSMPPPAAPPPRYAVRRLNRAVLVVAAFVLVVTLLVAIFLAAPPAPHRAGAAPPLRFDGGAPGFLRQPPAAWTRAPAGQAGAVGAMGASGTEVGALGHGEPAAAQKEEAAAGAAGPAAAMAGAAGPAAAAAEQERLLRLIENGPDARTPSGGLAGLPPHGTGAGREAGREDWSSPPPADDRRAAFLRALRSPVAVTRATSIHDANPWPAAPSPAAPSPAASWFASPSPAAAWPGAPSPAAPSPGAPWPAAPSPATAPAAGETAAPIAGLALLHEDGGAGALGGGGGRDAGGLMPSRPAAAPAAADPWDPAPARATARGLAAQPAAAAGGGSAGAAAAWRYLPPPPPGTVAAGTLIPALLLTAVNSDLPGPLLGQVSRDVYDDRLLAVVIPRGTRLLGRYEDQVAAGQRRLLVAWTRLLFPDGSSLEVPGLPATDTAGAAGIPALADNHLRRVFGNAALLSLLGAGAQLSQPPPTGFAQPPSSQQVAAGALGQELANVALQLVRRDLAVQPTLRLPAATPFDVFVTGDLPLGTARRAAATTTPGGAR
jgi:type IV secretory pathway VirB10-like protein